MAKEIPLITIIIPTYNGESTIVRSVNSALNQSYKNIEVIVIDDKSTDLTLSVLGKIDDTRLRVISLPENKGGSHARNVGIKSSSGEYIAFLDDDDESLPNRIESQLKSLLSKNSSDFKISSSSYYIQSGAEWKLVKKIEEEQTIGNILCMKHGTGACGSTLMIHRSLVNIVGLFDETFERHQDVEYTLRLLSKTKMTIVTEPLVRVHGHSGVPNADKVLKVKEYFLEKFEDVIESLPPKVQREVYARHWLQVARFFALDRDIENTCKYLFKSLSFTLVKSDFIKILPKETYFMIPFYYLRSLIVGKRKWSK